MRVLLNMRDVNALRGDFAEYERCVFADWNVVFLKCTFADLYIRGVL